MVMQVPDSSRLPVLTRLDGVDRQLQWLGERVNVGRKPMADSDQQPQAELEIKCRPLDSVLEEVLCKGSLMDRVASLEQRVLKLTMELEERDRASFRLMSSAHDGCCSPTKQKKNVPESAMVTTELGNSSFAKQLKASPVLKSTSKKRTHGVFRYRKWLAWIQTGC